MEDEPVIALGQDLLGDAAWLLGVQHCPEVVLAAFFHPGDEGTLALRSGGTQHRLGLLHNRDDRDTARVFLGELRLVALKKLLKDHPCQRET